MTSEFARFEGNWAGANGFRMMPADPLSESPATAAITVAAGGHLTSFAYSWAHADDGPQDGTVVFGQLDDGSLTALWADSWHQQPAPMSMVGAIDGATHSLSGDYGCGWEWRIVLECSDDAIAMRMENVIPAEHATPEVPAGPYPAMEMTLRRA